MDTTTPQRTTAARIAGIVGLLGALAAVVTDLYELLTLPTEVSATASLRNVAIHLTAVLALAGLAALGATGTTWWARGGVGVAALGFFTLICGELIDPFEPAAAAPMFEIAPVIIGAGLVLAGIGVLRSRRWSTWRRFAPLACGTYLFVIFLPVVIVTGTEAGLWSALIGWDLCLAALGLAVAQQATSPVPTTSARAA